MGGDPYRLLDYMTQSILYGASSLACLCSSGILSIFVYAQRRAVEEFQTLQPLTPEELLELFSGRYRKQVQERRQMQLPDKIEISGKFLVKGEVSAPIMIPSIDNKTQLVYMKLLSEKVCLRASIDGQSRNVVEKRSEPETSSALKLFYLGQSSWGKRGIQHKSYVNSTEFESSATRCLVTNYNSAKTDLSSALSLVAVVSKQNDSVKPNSTIPANAMLVVGLKQKQFGIAINDSLLIYGSVIFDLSTFQLIIDYPDFIAKNKSDILSVLAKNLHIKAIASFILFSLGVFYAYKSATAYLKHRKHELHQKQKLIAKRRER